MWRLNHSPCLYCRLGGEVKAATLSENHTAKRLALTHPAQHAASHRENTTHPLFLLLVIEDMAPKRKSRVTKKRPVEDDAQEEKEDVVLSEERKDEIGEEQIQMEVETTRTVDPVKSSSLSVEDIASSPIATIASQFWPARHDVSVFLHQTDWLRDMSNMYRILF